MADNRRGFYFQNLLIAHPDQDRLAAIQTTRVNANLSIREEPTHGQHFQSSLTIPFLFALHSYQIMGGDVGEWGPGLDVIGVLDKPASNRRLRCLALQVPGLVGLESQSFGQFGVVRCPAGSYKVFQNCGVGFLYQR